MGRVVGEVWRSRMKKSDLDLKRGMMADIEEQQRTGSSGMQIYILNLVTSLPKSAHYLVVPLKAQYK